MEAGEKEGSKKQRKAAKVCLSIEWWQSKPSVPRQTIFYVLKSKCPCTRKCSCCTFLYVWKVHSNWKKIQWWNPLMEICNLAQWRYSCHVLGMSFASRVCVAVHSTVDNIKALFLHLIPVTLRLGRLRINFQGAKKWVGTARDQGIDPSGGINITPCYSGSLASLSCSLWSQCLIASQWANNHAGQNTEINVNLLSKFSLCSAPASSDK